jgi:ABC-type cobalt transport system substrate-binding protein
MNNSNKLLLVVVVLTLMMFGVAISGRFFVDKVADRVIQKLQKDYSPSPYGPGIDPDKLDAEKINTPPTKSNQFSDWGTSR